MAGVKGRSGGARPGSGPKPKTSTVPANEDALAFLLAVQNDLKLPIAQRVRAAIAAAQYQHPKMGQDAAKKRGSGKAPGGRFKAVAAPKLVVNNT